MSIKIKKMLIAGGNLTALVYECPFDKQENISKKLLQNVEQVGFVSFKKAVPTLKMMGNELCINATLAFASTLKKSGKLATSGLKGLISYSNKKGVTTIKIPIEFNRLDNIVLLGGIGFIIYETNEESKINKSELIALSKKHKLPAFGGIIYDEKKITPYVYVKNVDSFVKESACGSGSIAFSLFSGIENVIQPTNEIITVKKSKFIEISAKVTICE